MYIHICLISNHTNNTRVHRVNPLVSMYCMYSSMHDLFHGSSSQIMKFIMYQGQSKHIDYKSALLLCQ